MVQIKGESVIKFSNSYAALPARFYVRQNPVPVEDPQLIAFNAPLAGDLGMVADRADEAALAAIFSGNAVPEGAEYLAMAYAGHQFGNFVPQLGDGRALLMGEVRGKDGGLYDIQLKGAGRTPFSRGGDGRAALGPVLREYLVSEAMHALGLPTTRALAAVTTGEKVYRDDGALPGAIMTRVAAGHVRIGTFQFFAARKDTEAVQILADYVIGRHYPDLHAEKNPYLALLEAVAVRQAALVAQWMGVGFIHGVMNTDNTAISGETIDYGPCAFMDSYDPHTVFSFIDEFGRYSYGNQPKIAQWNLARFAETLLPLMDEDAEKAVERAQETLSVFAQRFQEDWLEGMRAKIGLAQKEEGDMALLEELLQSMQEEKADFTLVFRLLCDVADSENIESGAQEKFEALFGNPRSIKTWLEKWQARLAREKAKPATRAAAMRKRNPAYIPRNHRVEQALNAAVREGDFKPFQTLQKVLAKPYQERSTYAEYEEPPRPEERVCRTFCGT
ncbi:MAG: YdiU family protein [Micavibrio sp.]|nr:MAG: YdiU family protein [Micavibrio sp.]